MKQLICFSLWGSDPFYWNGAIKNINLAKKFYPGWICRFYVDNKCDPALIEKLKNNNVEIIIVDKNIIPNGMFWRFLGAMDPEVSTFLSRDCDSRISERESIAVKEWLESDKPFHIMRDHPHHDVPILGGMWGCRTDFFKKLQIEFDMIQWAKKDGKGIDQDFLTTIYPKIKEHAFEHAEFYIINPNNTRSFSTSRNDYEYIGEIFDSNDKRDEKCLSYIKAYYENNKFNLK